MKIKHHNMKRGPRYRAERRQLRRTGIPMTTVVSNMTTVVSNEEFNEIVADLQDTHFDAVAEIEKAYPAIELEPYKCSVCGASGDDPCMTKTGNKAKSRHAGRDVL